MDKTSRRDLIKQLVLAKSKGNKTVVKSQKKVESKVDFIAFIEPTENDVMEELCRLDGFVEKK